VLPLDLGHWTLSIDAGLPLSLPADALKPGEPLVVPLPANAFDAHGGVLALFNDAGLRVDAAAYDGGDPAKGWSDSFG
jgi:hypothetical protein